jgi:hypothetical protein
MQHRELALFGQAQSSCHQASFYQAKVGFH